MAWLVLIVSGAMEAVWATALAASDGLRRPGPAAVFALALAASMSGLAYAMTTVPTGTAYAVWVGTGAVLTVAWATFRGREPASVTRVLLLAALIGCVVGLKTVG